ncbi:MAG: hypothetical protein MUP76_05110, partial [Acidimicrobiia bacterium]|nr:hypothetical protein [Acidimicrobiia bacterium]
ASDLAASMLEAYNTGDYSAFSSSFTNAFIDEMDEAAFQAWRAPLIASIGLYQEIIEATATDTSGGEANRHVFHASFDNDESVQFTIVFKPGTDRINRVEMKPDK